jgi:transposase
MTTRRPYPSDISDARWELIGPTLPAWQQARIDRRPTREPARTGLREVFNALLYLGRTGIAWRYLPRDFPPHGTVYFYYAAWRDEGILAQLNWELTGLARAKEGRSAEPTAAIIDTQSVKTSTNPPLETQGTDAAKLIVGRKRGVATDALGLLPAVIVRAASVHENNAGIRVLNQAKALHPTITKVWVDQGFKNRFVEHAATLGINAEVVTRNPEARGFHVLKRRWVVEICQPECTLRGVSVGSWPSFHFRRECQPGGRVRCSRSAASSSGPACAISRHGLRLSRRAWSQPRLIQV